MQTLQQLESGQLAGVTKLKLSCGLTSFPKEIFQLAETLEHLDLSGNALSSLPAGFDRFRKLKIAFFSDNNFTRFPEALAACPALEMLGFKANTLTEIPENSLPQTLRWLILTDNRIPALPRSIGQCTGLRKVMLAGNKLQDLPEEMAGLRELELLRISANNFSALPNWLFNLPKLSWLAFAGNPCSLPLDQPVALPHIPWPELTLEEILGEGASGLIYRAGWQPLQGLAGEVAVKVFKGQVTSDGFPTDEMAACMAAGAHPNLVAVLGKISQHPEQKQGLVLGLIPPDFKNLGGPPDFRTCTRDTFPAGLSFSFSTIVSITRGVASAALQLHNRGLMHGDLYAHNILLNKTAHPLLGDFGAASPYDRFSDSAAAKERLEVRAFGCLLEDLLDRVEETSLQKPGIDRLKQLKRECLQPEVLQRPSFKAINEVLDNL